MAESQNPGQPPPTNGASEESEAPEQFRPMITRRDFLIGTGAGAVTVGVVAGAGFAVTQGRQTAPQVVPTAPGAPAVAVPGAAVPAPAQQPGAVPVTALPLSMRRVMLDVDGRKHDVVVDVRDSLWETMNYNLGLSNSNLGCDRAQCGACAVLVDGRAVNGCTVLSARLGRGQKILTVAGITSGPGPQGLHPIQRAFWLDGGFQCGICTRGFIMSSYALLQTNTNPTNAQIKDALAGNICRCGEYAKMFVAVKTAAAEMRGEKVSYQAPLAMVEAPRPQAAAAPAQAAGPTAKQFQFATALGTIEQYDELAIELKGRPGIVDVAGSERTVTITWNPAQLDEAKVRQMLAETGHPVQP